MCVCVLVEDNVHQPVLSLSRHGQFNSDLTGININVCGSRGVNLRKQTENNIDEEFKDKQLLRGTKQISRL